jgi:hypothetical protein
LVNEELSKAQGVSREAGAKLTAAKLRCEAQEAEVARLRRSLDEAATHQVDPQVVKDLKEEITRLRIQAAGFQAQVELLERLHNSAQGAKTNRNKKSYHVDDDHDDDDDDDGDDDSQYVSDDAGAWDGSCYECASSVAVPGFDPQKVYAGTATATMTQTAVASGAPGRPPKPPSGGGGKDPFGGGAPARSEDSGSTAGPRAKQTPSGGPPGGGGDDDSSGSSDDENRAPHRARPLRLPRTAAPPDRRRRKKELGDIKIAQFPKSAADYSSWYDALVSAVCATALDEDEAFAWIQRVDANDCTFEELVNVESEQSLDAKLRAALVKYTSGDFKDKHRDLCDALAAKSHELKKAVPPRMIRGRQVSHVVKGFFAARDAKRITFELVNLVNYQYAGDAKLPQWKAHWDHMVLNLRFALSPGQLGDIYLPKIPSE